MFHFLDFDAPIELEEVLAEFRQNLDVLDDRVKQVTERLIPRFKDIQVEVSTDMKRVFIVFIEETFSNCQRRVRGTSSTSLPNAQWSCQGSNTLRAVRAQGNILAPDSYGRANLPSVTRVQFSAPTLAADLNLFQYDLPYRPTIHPTLQDPVSLLPRPKSKKPQGSAKQEEDHQAVLWHGPQPVRSWFEQRIYNAVYPFQALIESPNTVSTQGESSWPPSTLSVQEDDQQRVEKDMGIPLHQDSDATSVDVFTP